MTYYIGTMPVGQDIRHFGILGQKWGKRNGPPYPLGYSAHSAKEKKLNPKKRISAGSSTKTTKIAKAKTKRLKKSIWDKWDELPEEKKKRIKKAALIGTAAAVAGVAAYSGAHRYIQDNVGHTIKAGKKMQVVGNAAKDFSRSFYTTDRAVDKMKYKGMYGLQRKMTSASGLRPDIDSDVYKHVLKATKDIKIAPNKVAYSEFENLYRNNSDFRRSVKKAIVFTDLGELWRQQPQYLKFLNVASKLSAVDKNVDKKTLRKAYELINIGNTMNDESRSAMKTLSDSLRKKGYGGVYDINDLRYSGYRSKGAAIIFDKQPIIEDKVKKIKTGELAVNYLGADLAINYPIYGATAAGLGYKSYKRHKDRKEKSK